MLNRLYQKRDWVGLWYEVLKERGENDLCVFIRSNGEKEEKNLFSHSKMDGAGAVSYYMNQWGSPIETRQSSYKSNLSLIKIFKLIYKNLKIAPKNNTSWKYFDPHAKLDDPSLIYKLVLSKEETLNFKKFCKENKLSENSIIISEFSNIIKDLVNNSNETHSWLFPVNMRGITNKTDPYSNHSSFIPIETKFDRNYQVIQGQLREKLKSLQYIGIWWVHHIGMFISKEKMRNLSLKSSEKNFWLGTISNMGTWDTPKNYSPISKDEGWFFAAPSSKNFPIGFVIININGRLCFSLRIHPAIHKEPCKAASDILSKFKNRLNNLY